MENKGQQLQRYVTFTIYAFKGALPGLRRLLVTKSPLKMLLISPQQLFSFSRNLLFCLDNFGRVAKRFD